MKYTYKKMKSPVGELTLIASKKGLAAILWENDDPSRVRATADLKDIKSPILVKTQTQLKEYFDGLRTSFSIPLDPLGTEFQIKVWKELKKIKFGETISYLELAKRIGNPNASRAVGGANGKNPLSIIVPCHRVIGSNGKLTGFAGGLNGKLKLLELEGYNVNE